MIVAMMGDTRTTIIDDYCLSLVAAGRRPETVATRRRQVTLLCRAVDPLTATRDDLVRWLACPRWAPNTRAANRGAVRSFFGWMQDSGRRADDPSARLAPVRVPAPCPHPAPEALLARARALSASPFERVMVDLAARAGLRRSEIARLRHGDLQSDDTGRDVLRVTGKGGRTRVVPIPPDLAEAIRALRSEWVMPGRYPGQPMSPAHVGQSLSRLLGPGFSGHSLRHRYATRAYSATHDLLAVQQLLGHASPATTQGYVRVDDDSLRAAALAAS